MISNHDEASEAMEQFGIKSFHFSITHQNKASQGKLEIDILRYLNIHVVVLVRYMQILTENFLQAYPHKIINIHHSFLPAFAGFCRGQSLSAGL